MAVQELRRIESEVEHFIDASAYFQPWRARRVVSVCVRDVVVRRIRGVAWRLGLGVGLALKRRRPGRRTLNNTGTAPSSR
jgi:hypothetical protein